MDLVFSRVTARHMHELIVAGRTVVRDGRVLGVDLEAARKEVMLRMRSGQPGMASFAAALSQLDRALAEHMERQFSCT